MRKPVGTPSGAGSSGSAQIPMDLAPAPDFSFDNFTETKCNADALALVKGWRSWPSPVLLLQGPHGAGKTHLGQAWAKSVDGLCLSGKDLGGIPDTATMIFIDAADQADPKAVFSLINQALSGSISALLLASTLPPAEWPHGLLDLFSRMKNTAVATLYEPDDALLEAVLRKLFEDAGRSVSQDLVKYLIIRCDRSVGALRSLVLDLDGAARAKKADLTKAFAARYLKARELDRDRDQSR